MIGGRVTGQFVAGSRGQIFLQLRRPEGTLRGCVLIIPPFAEEMNKCRRTFTELGCALASSGIATLVPDLYGTGDSSGEFADATLQTWLDDLRLAAEWARGQVGPVSGLFAVRFGCALATAAVQMDGFPAVPRTVLCQPMFDGARLIGQFLRLRTAAGLMEGRTESISELRQLLGNGKIVEVAGYGLASDLAVDLEKVAQPKELPGKLGSILWLEVSRGAGGPAGSQAITRLQLGSSGLSQTPTVISVQGEPFWASTEIVVNAEAVRLSLEHLS